MTWKSRGELLHRSTMTKKCVIFLCIGSFCAGMFFTNRYITFMICHVSYCFPYSWLIITSLELSWFCSIVSVNKFVLIFQIFIMFLSKNNQVVRAGCVWIHWILFVSEEIPWIWFCEDVSILIKFSSWSLQIEAFLVDYICLIYLMFIKTHSRSGMDLNQLLCLIDLTPIDKSILV